MEFGHLALVKKMRLVVLPALLTAISAAAFAQDSASTHVETVVVTGARGDDTKGPPCSLHLLNMVPMQITNNVMTVPAGINGKPGTFQFSTAAIANQMTNAAARAFGLTPGDPRRGRELTGDVAAAMNMVTTRPGGMTTTGIDGSTVYADTAVREVYDSKGTAYANTVMVAEFSVQTMLTREVDFFIAPLPPPGVDGVLNLDLFQPFDIDLNFAARSLNFFSQDHCSGKILYWRAPGVAAVPFVKKDNRILVQVMLEGKDLTAVIDTGSPISVVRFEAAARLFGITPDAPGLKLVGQHHDDSRQDLYAYNFKTLSFGKVAIGNPHLVLTQDILVRGADPNANTSTRVISDADEAQPDMIIGMDLLKLTHLYIAQHERVLYITQAPELAADSLAAQPVVQVTPFRP